MAGAREQTSPEEAREKATPLISGTLDLGSNNNLTSSPFATVAVKKGLTNPGIRQQNITPAVVESLDGVENIASSPVKLERVRAAIGNIVRAHKLAKLHKKVPAKGELKDSTKERQRFKELLKDNSKTSSPAKEEKLSRIVKVLNNRIVLDKDRNEFLLQAEYISEKPHVNVKIMTKEKQLKQIGHLKVYLSEALVYSFYIKIEVIDYRGYGLSTRIFETLSGVIEKGDKLEDYITEPKTREKIFEEFQHLGGSDHLDWGAAEDFSVDEKMLVAVIENTPIGYMFARAGFGGFKFKISQQGKFVEGVEALKIAMNLAIREHTVEKAVTIGRTPKGKIQAFSIEATKTQSSSPMVQPIVKLSVKKERGYDPHKPAVIVLLWDMDSRRVLLGPVGQLLNAALRLDMFLGDKYQVLLYSPRPKDRIAKEARETLNIFIKDRLLLVDDDFISDKKPRIACVVDHPMVAIYRRLVSSDDSFDPDIPRYNLRMFAEGKGIDIYEPSLKGPWNIPGEFENLLEQLEGVDNLQLKQGVLGAISEFGEEIYEKTFGVLYSYPNERTLIGLLYTLGLLIHHKDAYEKGVTYLAILSRYLFNNGILNSALEKALAHINSIFMSFDQAK